MIVATGVDICEISRMAGLLARHPAQTEARLFTAGEIAYCRRKARSAQSFAARFATKEAVMKLLGTGWSQGIRWRDIEVVRSTGGPPSVKLHGEAGRRAARMGIARIHLSITHSGDMAMAHVIGETA